MTGEEIEEVENSGFRTHGPTICIGTVLNNSTIIQVYSRGLILLNEDGKRIKKISTSDPQDVIVACTIKDPYLTVLLKSGQVEIFQVSAETRLPVLLKKLKV